MAALCSWKQNSKSPGTAGRRLIPLILSMPLILGEAFDPHATSCRIVGHMEEHLTVGRVAELAGVTVRALHHYDEIGLVQPSARTAAGYRAYSAGDVERLR